MNTASRPMSNQGHARAILTLGLPLIGGHLGQVAIGVTDTVMVGWHSIEALAAITLAQTYFFVLFLFGSGFAMAVMPMVASFDAEGDETGIRRATRMGLWLSLGFALLVMPLMIWSEPVLRALGQGPALAAQGAEYLLIAGWGVIPALLVMVLKSYLAALERTQVVFWITILAALINALANYALIFGNWGAPALGLAGAAWASLITQGISLVCVVVYILIVVGLFSASAVMMGWLGTIPLAAHGIAVQLASITFMIHLGLSNAATIRAGNAYGRRDVPHMARGAVIVTAMSLLFAVVTIVVYLVWPEPLISIFMQQDEPAREDILAIGVGLLAMAALFQLVDGAQVIALGVLRGVQDTQVPMIYAAISYWGIGIP